MRTKAEKMKRIAKRAGACKDALDWLDQYDGPDSVEAVLAALSNEECEDWIEWWNALMRVGAVIHPTARVSRRSWICPGAEIAEGVIIGADTVIGEDVVIGADCWIDDGVTILPRAQIPAGAAINKGDII